MRLTEHKMNVLMLIGAVSLMALFSIIIQNYSANNENESVNVSILEAFNEQNLEDSLIISAVDADLKNIDKIIIIDSMQLRTNPLAYMTLLRNEKMVKALLEKGAQPKIAMKFLKDEDSKKYLMSINSEVKNIKQ